LEMKKLKEEQAIVESVLVWLQEGKDVRKKNWGSKEVGYTLFFSFAAFIRAESLS